MTNNLTFFANWKMNMDLKTSHAYIQTMLKKTPKKEQKHFVFLSPALLLPLLKNNLKNSYFNYGGQNCHFEDKGPFTGENSPLVLKQLGAKYSLVGHSERRQLFFENNTLIQKKTKALLKHNIQPIICVGETKKERTQGHTFKVLEQQITPILKTLISYRAKDRFKKQSTQNQLTIDSLKNNTHKPKSTKSNKPSKGILSTQITNPFSFENPINIYIAYEPVWAIGTGQSATTKDIVSVYTYIQKLFKAYNIDFYFLYGGSVNQKNAPTLSKIPGVCGFLVGGASLEPNTFLNLYHSCLAV